MNVELLKKVAAKFRRMRHKKHFTMEVYAQKTDCGTAGCVFMHALIISGYKPKFDRRYRSDSYSFISPAGRTCDAFRAGCRVLRLTAAQGMLLVSAANWPAEFGGGYDPNPKLYNNPKVAAARIEHFIATNGKE